MARIGTYSIDGTVDNMDKFLGTSSEEGRTANYTPNVIADYFNRYALTEAGRHAQTFDYGGTITGTEIPGDNAGKLYVWGEAGSSPSIALSEITNVVVSDYTNGEVLSRPVLDQFSGEIIKIGGTGVTGAKSYGLYAVTEIQPYATGLVQLTVSYQSGSMGNITDDDYNTVQLSHVAPGNVTLGGIIQSVAVAANPDNDTYTLTITPVEGDPFVSTWNDTSHTILTGGDAPTGAVGSVGDFYIQTGDTPMLFGPKTDDGWGNATSMRGAPVDEVTYTGGDVPGSTTQVTFQVLGNSVGTVTVQPGVDGEDGAQGDPGTDGVGITRADVCQAAGDPIASCTTELVGHLLVTLTDGTVVDAGSIDDIVAPAWTQISGRPTNLVSEGDIATWAGVDNTETIPASKIPASTFETHVFDGNYTQLKADTTLTFNEGDLYILTNPGDSDNGEYIFIGSNGTTGPTTDDDWKGVSGNIVNLGTTVSGTQVVITNSDGDNATLTGATTTAAGVLTAAQLALINANTAKVGLSFGSSAGQVVPFAEGNSTATIPGGRLDAATSSVQGALSATDFNKLQNISVTEDVDLDDLSVVVIPTDVSDVDNPAYGIEVDGTSYNFPFSIVTTTASNEPEIDKLEINSLSQAVARLTVLSNGNAGEYTLDVTVDVATDSSNGLMPSALFTAANKFANNEGNYTNVNSVWSTSFDNRGDSSVATNQILKVPGIMGGSTTDTTDDAYNPYSTYGFMNSDQYNYLSTIVMNADRVTAITDSENVVTGIRIHSAPDGNTLLNPGTEITTDILFPEGGTGVVANPDGDATEALDKIEIGDTIYSVGGAVEWGPSGSEAEAATVRPSSGGELTWSVSSDVVTPTIRSASDTQSGLIDSTTYAQIGTNEDNITQNTTDIATNTSAIANIDQFDPGNDGTQGQVLTKGTGDTYSWQDEGEYDGITVEHPGDTAITGTHKLQFSGNGISIAVDPNDAERAIVTITGGGGTNDITVNTPTITPASEAQFENVDQTITLGASWTHSSDTTLSPTGSQCTLAKDGTTVNTRALTQTELDAGTVSYTYTGNFVTSATDNTIVPYVLSCTVNGTGSETDTNSHTYTYPAYKPAASSSELSSPANFENDSQGDTTGGTLYVEKYDSGQWTTDFKPANTGWKAETPASVPATLPTGFTYSDTGNTLTITATAFDSADTDLQFTNQYTQTTPGDNTAITETIDVMAQTTFAREISLRAGAVANTGGAPVFVDEDNNTLGLRDLNEFNAFTDRDILFGTTSQSDIEATTIPITIDDSGAKYIYFVYDAALPDLTAIKIGNFPEDLSDYTAATVGAYKTYIKKTSTAPSSNFEYTLEF